MGVVAQGGREQGLPEIKGALRGAERWGVCEGSTSPLPALRASAPLRGGGSGVKGKCGSVCEDPSAPSPLTPTPTLDSSQTSPGQGRSEDGGWW